MSLTDTYLVTSKNLESFFNALQSAQAPEKFTYKFMESLEFTSSNDRLLLKLLKALALIDDSGTPTQLYYDFLDQTQSRIVVAKAVREAYGDLFAINKKANELSLDEVQNKLKTLTQGKKSENVLRWMANTFKALCDYADWQGLEQQAAGGTQPPPEPAREDVPRIPPTERDLEAPHAKGAKTELHYNIQIHLPESRDAAVYDAIFQSLRKHLL
jgi:hypothetical protein